MARRNPKGPKQHAFAGKGTGHPSNSKLLAELVVNSNMVLAYWLIGREIKEVAK